MSDLIVKLESLRDSKEWEKLCKEVEERYEWNRIALYQIKKEKRWMAELHSEADMIQHEICTISDLIWDLDVLKDKDCKKALIEDLEKSKKWRIDRLYGRTHEYKLNLIVPDDAYTAEDISRAEIWWTECFKNLPNKLIEELKVKETQVKEMQDAEVQEQIDALASLESEGL